MSSEELVIVHAITGWDTASTLAGRGGKTAVVWKASLKVTNAFLNLASAPLGILSQHSRDLRYSCMTAPAHILL